MRLEGWHVIVMVGLVLMLAAVVGIVLMVAAARRGRAAGPAGTGRPGQGPGGGSGGKEQRLRELDDLRRREVIGEDEYRVARARVLDS